MESSGITKALLVMRLTALILLIGSLQVTATGFSQTTITLSKKDASLEEVLTEIGRQSGYKYFFADQLEDQARRVSIDVLNAPLEEALNLCFRDQPFTYSIFKKTIVIRQKKIEENRSSTPAILSKISGIVRNEKLEPLNGASVRIENSHQGTSTNEKGIFELTNVPADAKIEVSYAGYERKEFLIQGKLYLELVLPLSNSSLDQVQVIAYGTGTQRFSTGDVTTVKAADIEKQPVANALLALEGRVPGLFVSQVTGLPGSGAEVLIRGGASISSGKNPFYIVDGVPYPSELLPNLGGPIYNPGNLAGPFGNPMNFLNPSDIESISVLKDAAATAIYGSRAANGAIIVTTKHGKAGTAKVDINLQNGYGQVARKMDLLNTPEYLAFRNEGYLNDGVSPYPFDYDINGFWDTTRNIDWQKVLIGRMAQYMNWSANVSGGNASSQYLVGANFHRETTVFPLDFDDLKGSAHFNIKTLSANQKFGLQLSGNYMVDNNHLPAIDLTSQAMELPPDAPPLYTSDGKINWDTYMGSSTFQNPLAFLNNEYQNKTNNLIGNLLLSYDILPSLEIRSSFGYNNLESKDMVTNSLLSVAPESRAYFARSALYGNNSINDWIIEPQMSYKTKFANGRLEALVGTTIHQSNTRDIQLAGTGYNSDELLDDIGSAYAISGHYSSASTYKYNAIFGRLDYNWQEKFILNLTYRRDGSSKFGASSQFHNFGALGAAWIFSEERLVKDNFPLISFGKIRASYGTTGNDQIPDYQYYNLYNARPVDVSYQGILALAPNNLTNPYLHWESTRKLEFGFELGLIKDRILVNVSYFQNQSSDQLATYSLPIITGFNYIESNFPAIMQNSGVEATLKTDNIRTRDFAWSTSFNYSLQRNKLLAFPGLANSPYRNLLIVGKSTNILHVFHLVRVNPQTGIYQFDDGNKGTTSAPDTIYPGASTSLVDPTPVFYGGIENSLRFRNFQLDFLFQFVKQIGTNAFYGWGQPGIPTGGNEPAYFRDRWQQPGQIATHQRFDEIFSGSGPTANNAQMDVVRSDAAFSDASYIRLKNLSFSWKMSGDWIKKARLNEARMYLSGQNLLTFTSYKGLDPETKATLSLPPLRVLTIGIQLGL